MKVWFIQITVGDFVPVLSIVHDLLDGATMERGTSFGHATDVRTDVVEKDREPLYSYPCEQQGSGGAPLLKSWETIGTRAVQDNPIFGLVFRRDPVGVFGEE